MNRRQTIPAELRYTIEDFNRQFPTDDACFEHLREQRFPDGMAYCGKCKGQRQHHRVKGRPVYACDDCLTQISPMAGTIFEHSSTSLRLWYYAMYLMASTRCRISAKQIQRETGVTYKTAWRMFRQIRSLLSEPDMQLEGSTVEVDETYMGGVRKYGRGRPMRGDKKKTPVVAIVQRKGKVLATIAPDASEKTLSAIIRKHVAPQSMIYTDEWAGYQRIPYLRDDEGKPLDYRHRHIAHSKGQYVYKDIHTNSVEGLWSLIKRGIGGVYHSVSPKYLQTYLDEYCFRYNRRDKGNLQFKSILERA